MAASAITTAVIAPVAKLDEVIPPAAGFAVNVSVTLNAALSMAPAAKVAAKMPPVAIYPTDPLTLATIWSTSILVALRLREVVGFSTFAQSIPAAPVAV